jgi:hypothetical protein
VESELKKRPWSGLFYPENFYVKDQHQGHLRKQKSQKAKLLAFD